jgi:hypothetical protein
VFTSALLSIVRCAILTPQKHCFLLLLRNRRVYRGTAYELPEQIRYIAPSLRLFTPNSLTVCHLSFLLKFLPLIASSCKLFFSLSRGVHSPTTTSALSLKPARPERFLDKLSVSPVIIIIKVFFYFLSLSQHDHPKFSSFLSLTLQTVGAITHGVADAPTVPAPPVFAVSFSGSEGVHPPQAPVRRSS